MRSVQGWHSGSVRFRSSGGFLFLPTVLSIFLCLGLLPQGLKMSALAPDIMFAFKTGKGGGDREKAFSYHGDIFLDIHCQASPSILLARIVTWLPLVTKLAGKRCIWEGKTLPWLLQIDRIQLLDLQSLTSLLFTYIQN